MKKFIFSLTLLFSSLAFAQNHYAELKDNFHNSDIPQISMINSYWVGLCYDQNNNPSPAALAFDVVNGSVEAAFGVNPGAPQDFFGKMSHDQFKREASEAGAFYGLQSNGVVWYTTTSDGSLSMGKFVENGRTFFVLSLASEQGMPLMYCGLVAR